jgi:hypothetical protein
MTVDHYLGIILIEPGFDCGLIDIHDLYRLLQHCGGAVSAYSSSDLLAFEQWFC